MKRSIRESLDNDIAEIRILIIPDAQEKNRQRLENTDPKKEQYQESVSLSFFWIKIGDNTREKDEYALATLGEKHTGKGSCFIPFPSTMVVKKKAVTKKPAAKKPAAKKKACGCGCKCK